VIIHKNPTTLQIFTLAIKQLFLAIQPLILQPAHRLTCNMAAFSQSSIWLRSIGMLVKATEQQHKLNSTLNSFLRIQATDVIN